MKSGLLRRPDLLPRGANGSCRFYHRLQLPSVFSKCLTWVGKSSPSHSDRVAPRSHLSRVAPKRNAAQFARGSPCGRARPPQSQLVIGRFADTLGSANERPRSGKTDLSLSYCLSRNVVKTSRSHRLERVIRRCISHVWLSGETHRANSATTPAFALPHIGEWLSPLRSSQL